MRFWATLVLGLLLAFGHAALAQVDLGAFERAVDERRYVAARKLLEALPEGPEKLLSKAELGMVTERSDRTASALKELSADQVPAALRARYLRLLAAREQASQTHAARDFQQAERLLRDGLRADPLPRDRVLLLQAQLRLARDKADHQEELLAQLFELSPQAGFEGRLQLLQQQGKTSEYLALLGMLEVQARAQNQTQNVLEFQLRTTLPLIRSGQTTRAVAILESALERSLADGETYLVSSTLLYLHWAKRSEGRTGVEAPQIDEALARLPEGDDKLKTLELAVRLFPQKADYFQQGVVLAQSLGDSLIAASFLAERAKLETDPELARNYRRQARELLRGQRLEGLEGGALGDEIASGLFLDHLGNEDDHEVLRRYRRALELSRNEAALTDIWSGMFRSVPQRDAPWVWTGPVFESVLERTAEWPKARRASEVASLFWQLQRPAVVTRRSGQATTFGVRPSVLAESLGVSLERNPELLESLLEGLAEHERADTDPRRAADKLSTLAGYLSALGRYQEALDLLRQSLPLEQGTRLGLVRRQARLTRLEQQLKLPTASALLDSLTDSTLATDYGPFDDPMFRASELAWFHLEKGRPDRAEALARKAVERIPAAWTLAERRHFGADEVLALALDAQGKSEEADLLLEQLRAEQGEAGQVWLDTLQAERLLGRGKVEEAATTLPRLDDAESDSRRIYLADLHRKVALAQGRSAAEMEAEIAATLSRMVAESGDAGLRSLLLATPAYAELTFLQPASPLPPSNRVVHGEVNGLEKVLEKLDALRRREPDNEALSQLGAVRVKAMVEGVGADEVMVRPILLRHSVLLLVASGGRLAVTERYLDVTEVRERMRRLSSMAADPGATTETLVEDGEYLAARLLQPALAEFPGRRDLLWLAQGELKELPLALLRWQGKALLETMAVTYLDGPGGAPKFALRASQPTLLIGGSDDLAGAREELAEVRALLPKGESWRLGQDFSTLQALVQRHPLVHISSHGLPPSATGTGELSGTEGSLSAFRLVDLAFPAGSLVVASACQVGSESGQGPGDSTVLNALRTAGAATVLASPWTVDDQTSRALVLSFYRRLLSSGRPSEALGKAQLELRRSHPHPYHWAGPRMVTGRAR